MTMRSHLHQRVFGVVMLVSSLAVQRAVGQQTVVLLPGDSESPAAAAAVRELRQDPSMRGLTIRAFPDAALTAAERRVVGAAALIIMDTHVRPVVLSLADEVRAATRRGGTAIAVGTNFEPEYADIGFVRDSALSQYFEAGGAQNLANMVRAAVRSRFRRRLTVAPVSPWPDAAYLDLVTATPVESFEAFEARYLATNPTHRGRPWVGIFFPRVTGTSGQLAPVQAVAAALQRRGLNPLPLYGWPATRDLPRFYLRPDGSTRIVALAAFGLKLGNVPDEIGPVLQRLDVPVFNAISLYQQNRAEWEASATGLDQIERAWQVGGAELAGVLSPTVVASKEHLTDAATGIRYVSATPIPERVERFADRIHKWTELRRLPASRKRVAVLYYNYPPGRENVGASYLNVLPRSLWEILRRLASDGIDLRTAPATADSLFSRVRAYGVNSRPGDQADVRRLATSGQVQLLSVAQYRTWFDRLPQSLRAEMITKWGEPETSTVMIWRDARNVPYFVFPAQRWGNVVLAAQPSRGWEQDIKTAYHDITLPPHHQYLAFYLWLQHGFGADAMVHVGTHGTHEWLSGKEVGFTAADPSEVMVAAVPQLYPYIVDNIGEGQQAKRRGMAAIITHMTPPLDKASLQPELRQLASLIVDYGVALDRGSLGAPAQLAEIDRRARRMGLYTDLSIKLESDALPSAAQVEEIEHHLKDIGERYTPFGMHTFGVAPADSMRAATADAILSLDSTADGSARAALRVTLIQRIETAARAELDALSAGLSGRYIAAGPGNDPIRNPDAYPTGKNFYGFDPSRLPTRETYRAGTALADAFVAQYRTRHKGAYPTRLVFNLWATETNRHEGSIEGEILALMGVRPTWDARGRVTGAALIPRDSLARPRVDVTIVPSGLYRDLFPVVMTLLDQAVTVVKESGELDTPLRRNIAVAKAALVARGIGEELAERMATVRLFTEPPGAYGVGLENVITAASSWKRESDVASVYFRRVGHLFGQGFWGNQSTQGDALAPIGEAVLKLALSGAQAVVHSRSSNVYGVLDNDDFYQYLGGTAMAVRQVDGATPEVLVADLRNPRAASTITIERAMGEEMRARYLNPKWISAMLAEGYAGARFVMQVTDNLWGWQVTVPDAVDAAKWNEMYATYVSDKHNLGVREKFAASGNLRAYQAMLDRMTSVVEKGYWSPDAEVLAGLTQMRVDVSAAVDAESRALGLTERASLAGAPGAAPGVSGRVSASVAAARTRSAMERAATTRMLERSAAAAAAASRAARATPTPQAEPIVRGRVLEEHPRSTRTLQAPVFWSLGLGLLVCTAALLLGVGWWRAGDAAPT